MAHRALTNGEIALAKTVFGDSIDYACVQLHDRRVLPAFLQKKTRAMAYLNKISFPGEGYRDDFSKDADPVVQSLFIHELAHVWQHQNKVLDTRAAFVRGMLRHKFHYAQAYAHRLEKGKDLTDYGMEQQACIIQDYFLLSRFGLDKPHRSARRNAAGENLKALYEGVLGRFLKNPSYARKKSKPPVRKGPGAG